MSATNIPRSPVIKAELHNTHDGLIHGSVTLPDGSHHPIKPAALPDAREQVLQLATSYVLVKIRHPTRLEVTDPDGWWLIGLQLDGTRIPLDSKPSNTTPPHDHVTAHPSANGRQPLPATHAVTPAQPDQSPNGRETARATDSPANERDTAAPPDAFSLTEPRDPLDLFAELAPAALTAAPTRPSPRPRRSTTIRHGSSRPALAAVALVLAAALTATLVLRATAGNEPARAARVPRATAHAHPHVVPSASSMSRSAVPGKPLAPRTSFPSPPALRRPARRPTHHAPPPARHRAQRPHPRGAERHHNTSPPPITAPPAAPAAAAPAPAETTTQTPTPAAPAAPAASDTTTRAAPQYTPPPAPAPCYPGELGC